MITHISSVGQVDREINEYFSSAFCLAKWYHTTIHLHTAKTHSCYHPAPHDIPLAEIKEDPSALHNTNHKMQERLEMLNGVKISGCNYCWNVESMGDDYISDRKIRNESFYTEQRINEIISNGPDFRVNPEYIEIAFSNECNFKCGYCHPVHSSSYYQESKKYGPFKDVSEHDVNVEWLTEVDEQNNPYVEAWWKWWPTVSKTLNILRITGGEPLLHKTTWQLFDELNLNPKPHLEININSNLGMSHRHVKRLVDNVQPLINNGKIRKFKLFSSLESWGKRAEYTRTGLDCEIWEKNLDTYLNGLQSHINIMCTYNILAVTSFKTFLKKILEWRQKYNNIIPDNLGVRPTVRKIRFDTPYLKEPLMFDIHLLPKDDYIIYFDECLEFIQNNMDENDVTKFSELEYERLRRVRDYFSEAQYDNNTIHRGRIDFYRWFSQFDKRRDVNFLETFPEMEDFWYLCKRASDEEYSNKINLTTIE